ncbi:MAG: nucleotide pyrophosphohydrolase [Methanomicrobiales archaeon]
MTNQWDFRDKIEDLIKFRDARDWRKFHYPKDLAAALSIEAAELQELFLWKGQEPSGQIISDPDRMNNIADELADVAIYLFLLTHELNIDLKEAIDRKIKKNELKYPI